MRIKKAHAFYCIAPTLVLCNGLKLLIVQWGAATHVVVFNLAKLESDREFIIQMYDAALYCTG
jgi:hypothetical protein